MKVYFEPKTMKIFIIFYFFVQNGASKPSNIASNIAGNSFHLNSGVHGGDIAGN